MSTKSFNKNFKIDPKVADEFRKNMSLFSEKDREDREAILKKIKQNNKKVEELLARF